MNKHIELVKKWLANPASVTKEELEANADAALDALDAAMYAADDDDADWTAEQALWAARAARDARAATGDATHWVKEYEEVNDEG